MDKQGPPSGLEGYKHSLNLFVQFSKIRILEVCMQTLVSICTLTTAGKPGVKHLSLCFKTKFK